MSCRSWVVSSERGAALVVERAEELAQATLAHHVQADGRLVEVEHLGVVQQRGGDVAAHPLAEAELAHRGVELVAEVEQVDEPVEVLAVARRRDAVHLLEQVERVAQREVPPQRRALAEDDPDATRELDAVAARVEAGHPHLPTGRHEDAGQHLDGRRLPGAVGPDVADHLAGIDGERQVVHGQHRSRGRGGGAPRPGGVRRRCARGRARRSVARVTDMVSSPWRCSGGRRSATRAGRRPWSARPRPARRTGTPRASRTGRSGRGGRGRGTS